MIKKTMRLLTVIIASSMLLTSCYSYETIVGNGAQNNVEVTKWNNYVILGLAPVGVSDPNVMAGDSEDYTVHTRQTFVNFLVTGLTFGIYSPTTTTVTK